MAGVRDDKRREVVVLCVVMGKGVAPARVVDWSCTLGSPWRGAKLLDSGSCRPYPSCAMWGARRLTTTKSRIGLPVESIRNGQARTAEYSEMDQEIY